MFLACYALWFHERQEKAAEMEIKIICAVYGEGAVTDRTCQKWRAKFHAGDFSLDNVPLSGRSLKLIAIHSNINWEQSVLHHEGASSQNILRISKSDIENHLYQLGYVIHFDVWLSHKLSEKPSYFLSLISACNSPLKLNENVPFLKQTVMDNER